jgi:hypothetical protein
MMTDTLARWLSSDSLPISSARRAVFKALSTAKPLRRLAVQQGMQR